MGLAAIKGAILEELILSLLGMIGYRTINAGEEDTRAGNSGLEVQGRGMWHQIDAFAAFDYTPAFMYPIRLILEAKCYNDVRPIGLDVVRNAVGVLKDISENYFTFPTSIIHNDQLKIQRFNYHSALFSTSGYTEGAQRYAIAHQIFLIQYDRVPLFKPLSEGLSQLQTEHFKSDVLKRKGAQQEIRLYIRALLKNSVIAEENPFEKEGTRFFIEKIVKPMKQIGGSYFGMLQGKWPMHLLSKKPLPQDLFINEDRIQCKVYGRNSTTWSFVPLNENENSPNWFRLEFDLPDEIARLVLAAKGDRIEIAQVKRAYFSCIYVSGQIGEVRRQVCLEMDGEWLNDYIDSIPARLPKAHSIDWE